MSTNSAAPEHENLPCLYNPESVAALAAYFRGIPGLTPELRNTAARAILRAKRSRDDTQDAQKTGLDFMYLDLNGIGGAHGEVGKEISRLKTETLQDILDGVRSKEFLCQYVELNYH